MSTRNRIPPAIEPLLSLPPEASLILITGTLGCCPVWLTSRFIGQALNPASSTSTDTDGEECSVMFASWMRDLPFWKGEVRRAVGYDVSKAIENRRLAFIDCLLGQSKSSFSPLDKELKDSIQRLSQDGTRILLVLDSPDVLLSTGSATAQQLNTLLLKLRSEVHAVVLICSADQPLVSAATQSERTNALSLETETARFLAQQAHNARLTISMRELATGAARDVSGVIQATRSTSAYDDVEDKLPRVEEMEALYLVQRDGGVKVFQRGSDTA